MEHVLEEALSVRGETRGECLLALSHIVSDTELGVELEQLYAIEESSDNPTDYIVEFETVILKQVVELLRRMGVEVLLSTIYEAPSKARWIFETIEAIDDYEDLLEIESIVVSGEDNIIVLDNLILKLIPESHSDVYDFIESVEPRFIRNISDTIRSRISSEMAEDDYANRGARLLRFLVKHPNIPFLNVFENFNNYDGLEQMTKAFDFTTVKAEDDDINLITILTIATSLSLYETEQEALDNLSEVVGAFDALSDVGFTLHNYKLLGISLNEAYSTTEEDENEEV